MSRRTSKDKNDRSSLPASYSSNMQDDMSDSNSNFGDNAGGSGHGSSGRTSSYRSTSDKPWNNSDEVDLMGANVNFHRGKSSSRAGGEEIDSGNDVGSRTSRSSTPPLASAMEEANPMTASVMRAPTIESSYTRYLKRLHKQQQQQQQQQKQEELSKTTASTIPRPPSSGNSAIGKGRLSATGMSSEMRRTSSENYLVSEQVNSVQDELSSALAQPRISLQVQRGRTPDSGYEAVAPKQTLEERQQQARNLRARRLRMGRTYCTSPTRSGKSSSPTRSSRSSARGSSPTRSSETASSVQPPKDTEQSPASSLPSASSPAAVDEGSSLGARATRASRQTSATPRQSSPAVEAYLQKKSNKSQEPQMDLGYGEASEPSPTATQASATTIPGDESKTSSENPSGARERFARRRSGEHSRNSADSDYADSRIASNRRAVFRTKSSEGDKGPLTNMRRGTRPGLSKTLSLLAMPAQSPANKPGELSSSDDGSTASSSSDDSSGVDHEEIDQIQTDIIAADDSVQQKTWSIRVCVVSAVDLPTNVVPNIPLSPLLKLGLSPAEDNELQPKDGKMQRPALRKPQIGEIVDSSGRRHEKKKEKKKASTRVRCTACKILSKRDNGSVEFHEELRWDRVAQPQQMTLTVELCVRGVLTPANIKESPPAAGQPGVVGVQQGLPGVVGQQRPGSIDLRSSLASQMSNDESLMTSQSGASRRGRHSQGGLKDGRDAKSKFSNFWARGKKTTAGAHLDGGVDKKNHDEKANAAAAVAQLLMEDSTGTKGTAATAATGASTISDESSSRAQWNNTQQLNRVTRQKHRNELDVQLSKVPESNKKQSKLKSRRNQQDEGQKSKKIKMTEDVLLGSIRIPLSDIPQLKEMLNSGGDEDTTTHQAAARIERWYELDNINSSVVPSSLQTRMNSSRNLTASSRNLINPSTASGSSKVGKRNPSILLEISCYEPESLDDSEDDMDEASDTLGELGAPKTGLKLDKDKAPVDSVTVPKHDKRLSFQRRQTVEVRNLLKQEKIQKEENLEDPVLQPGVVDYIAVVGARDIGDQKQDDGSKGWVNSTPECCVLEQFPPDEFHPETNKDRLVELAQKVEWFCFPEGCRLWRGTSPPSHEDLNLKRFSASSPPSGFTSLASFDACLNCTTTVSWFVIASNSEDYGSNVVKTYGVCVRFYVAAPAGIDPTQDDFAQMVMNPGLSTLSQPNGGEHGHPGSDKATKRLWVPIGILLTSNLPIVGTLEAMLLRICESLSLKRSAGAGPYGGRGGAGGNKQSMINHIVHEELANLIINYQKPIPGVVNVSIPFLGERFNLTLPSWNSGLPRLPHGNSVASVCRLLGPDGLNFLLAAVLTECKIIMHSDDVANLAMVAEVITALIFPFTWSLPYIPVLPSPMLEFVEAPLSYMLGVPSCCMKDIDPSALEDVVVVNLDSCISSTRGIATKVPTPLPATMASNISHAVYRLLRAEEQTVDDFGASSFPSTRSSLPRLEQESVAEREFRITVGLEVCGLLRGYQDCLVFASTSQPVFNRDKFLKKAPALFEERVNATASAQQGSRPAVKWVMSPRSKRFLSLLVNCQHFHQFLETLGADDSQCFHEFVGMWYKGDEKKTPQSLTDIGYSLDLNKSLSYLMKYLRKGEDMIPTYIVNSPATTATDAEDSGDAANGADETMGAVGEFPHNLLLPIVASNDDSKDSQGGSKGGGGVHSISVEYLLELEKNPWRYNKAFDIPYDHVFSADNKKGMGKNEIVDNDEKKNKNKNKSTKRVFEIAEKVKLRDAIGERRYRAWQAAKEQNNQSLLDDSERAKSIGEINAADVNGALDLASLLTSATEDTFSETSSAASSRGDANSANSRRTTSLTPEQQRVADAKDRDVLRRCLERAYACKQQVDGSQDQDFSDVFTLHGRDLVSQAEVALRNPSAQRFLLSILKKRKQTQGFEEGARSSNPRRRSSSHSNSSTVSRLEPIAFECVVRLCCAMLDSCMEAKEYEPAYSLLSHTAGLFALQPSDDPNEHNHAEDEKDIEARTMYVTARIGLHPLFAELGLWEQVMNLHILDRQQNDKSEQSAKSGSETLSKSDSSDGGQEGDASDVVEYEAAVATLYEMLGYGIPSEELARFATHVSDKNEWFKTERGRALLLLARRLSLRRENTVRSLTTGKKSDLDIMQGKSPEAGDSEEVTPGGGRKGSLGFIPDEEEDAKPEMSEINWCHPAAPSSRRISTADPSTGRLGTQNLLDMLEEQKLQNLGRHRISDYMKRSAVTNLATFGTSVVVTGGLDGGVFLAHTIMSSNELESLTDNDDNNANGSNNGLVRGLHLDWGSSGSRSVSGSASSTLDGEYGVGAVSCLAAAKGAGYRAGGAAGGIQVNSTKDTKGPMDDDDILAAMEGSRVVAGTTCGDLRVWSVKDVYSAVTFTKSGDESSMRPESRFSNSDGSSSMHVHRRSGRSDYASGSSFNRLKFSLRGRALSGHRGGVTCIDVPSHVYHPDSVVTGGADGLIKLWSLRTPTAGRKTNEIDGLGAGGSSTALFGSGAASPLVQRLRGSRGGDALSILSGHGGRILCVKTAWHGDRLLSGGADRTIRIWDLVGGGEKCLNTLSGHFGWITKVQYWGPNTIVSASTDRSIALWDARVRCSPLFVLRHHHSPISDLLVGSRTDPLMVSAASDGRVTTWDFRTLSGNNSTGDNSTSNPESAASTESPAVGSSPATHPKQKALRQCKVVRHPAAFMDLHAYGKFQKGSGPVLLSFGENRSQKTVLSVGSDAVMREWEVSTGKLVSEHVTGHCDMVSNFSSLSDSSGLPGTTQSGGESSSSGNFVGGTVTCSWDGTIRMRRVVSKK